MRAASIAFLLQVLTAHVPDLLALRSAECTTRSVQRHEPKNNVTASILYSSITIRLWRLPDTFWHLVRSIVRASRHFFVAANFFFVRAKIVGKKIWGDVVDSVEKSWKLEPSSRFLSRFKF